MNAESDKVAPHAQPGSSARRDPIVFSDLLCQSRARTFGYLLALVQNAADAEDVYQQTALLLWEKFDEFVPGTDFGAWATTIAHYTALNFLRRQSRRRWLFSKAAVARLAAVQAELRTPQVSKRLELLDECIESLALRERALLWQRYQGERSIEELAEQDSRTVAAVYKALSRIRTALSACIQRRMARESS